LSNRVQWFIVEAPPEVIYARDDRGVDFRR
jgi:hypothetical protein